MGRRDLTLTAAAALAAAGLSACGVVDREPNLIAGKRAFVSKCGSCHVLNRAGTKGNQGPNLDEAFQQSLRDGGVKGFSWYPMIRGRLVAINGRAVGPDDYAEDRAKRLGDREFNLSNTA
jgi:cytochrome c2